MAITFTSTTSSALVTVNDPNHGAGTGSFVTFSNANTGNSALNTKLNNEFSITSVTDSANYVITLSGNADAALTGAGSADAEYQFNVGINTVVPGTGWGAGKWGGTNTFALSTTINEGAEFSDSDTTLTVTSATGIVASDVILIDNELLTVTNVSSDNLTVTRGSKGTTASAHADGSIVQLATGNTSSANDFTGWGERSSDTVVGESLRLWSQDNFGEDLIFNQRDGFLFYWDKTLGTSTRAKSFLELSDAAPFKSRKVVVSERDRHVICFGASPLGSQTQDKLLVRFSSQENPFFWTPSSTNTAGSLRIGSGSEIITAVKTRREIIILTDTSVHSMQFIGPPFTFGINQLASAITVRGFNSAVAVGDAVMWMGYDRFYIYDGRVQVIPCSVRDHVFRDFNENQAEKVYAGVNSAFGEVFWFYPSNSNSVSNGGDGENDKYVVYNYDQKIWYVGNLKRSSWLDRGVYQYPIATDSNLLYNHEKGNDNDGTAFTSFIQSSPIDIQDGDQFVFLRRMLPDVSFDNSDNDINDGQKFVNMTFTGQRSPGGGLLTASSSSTTNQVSTITVNDTTELSHLRLRARSFALRVTSSAQKVNWRLGTNRVDLRRDGDR